MLLIKFAEFVSTGKLEISWFHGLSGGKSRWPCKLAPGPRSGIGTFPGVTVRGRVEGVGVAAKLNLASTDPRLSEPTPTSITETIRHKNIIKY